MSENESAVDRVRRYVWARDTMPMRQLNDDIHGVHSGTEYEGVLTLSDLRALLAEREALLKAGDDMADAIENLLRINMSPAPDGAAVKRAAAWRAIEEKAAYAGLTP